MKHELDRGIKIMKVGIIYGSSTGNTQTAAEMISEHLSTEHECILKDVDSLGVDDFLDYEFLVLGISTWYIGEPQDDWIDILDNMDGMDFNGIPFAIFGQGDQLGYPDTYQDGMGILYEKMINGGGVGKIGFTSTEGYDFDESKGIVDDQWCGLSLDEDNQGEMTDDRIERWCKVLLEEMNNYQDTQGNQELRQ
tara:strand:- start:347 stop:928 length:582 start_codon:yes stop_codon:yes gene_type:complete